MLRLNMRSLTSVTALTVASLLANAPHANATFILGTGNVGGLGNNVIVNACVGNAQGAAALVQGCLNTSHSTLVDISTTSGSFTANGGQARFEGSGSNISNFKINFDDASLGFSGLVFNINTQNGTSSNVSFVVNAVDPLGNLEAPQLFSSTISGSGNNFFNLTSADGEIATSVGVISTLANIVDIRQVRIAAADVPSLTSLPEPATAALFGAGLLGLAALRRRKAKA